MVAHPSNLIYPSTPLSHFRSYYSKDVRINFLNSIIGWNLETLEHLELVDDNCNWTDIIMQSDPEEYQFLDPIVVSFIIINNVTMVPHKSLSFRL